MVKTNEAMGFCASHDTCKISVTIPHASFDELKRRAIIQKRSISAQIRDYIEVGLEVDRDMELDSQDHGGSSEPVSLTAGTVAAEVTRDDRAGNLVLNSPQAAETDRDVCIVDISRCPTLRAVFMPPDQTKAIPACVPKPLGTEEG